MTTDSNVPASIFEPDDHLSGLRHSQCECSTACRVGGRVFITACSVVRIAA